LRGGAPKFYARIFKDREKRVLVEKISFNEEGIHPEGILSRRGNGLTTLWTFPGDMFGNGWEKKEKKFEGRKNSSLGTLLEIYYGLARGGSGKKISIKRNERQGERETKQRGGKLERGKLPRGLYQRLILRTGTSFPRISGSKSFQKQTPQLPSNRSDLP